MAMASPLKRSHEDVELESKDESIPVVDGKDSNQEVTTSTSHNTQPPQYSNTISTTSQLSGHMQANSGNMAKKPKLTAAEKAEAQVLKDTELQRKAEEKARKEEARRQKDEEKRLKEDERRQRQDDARKEREEKQKIKDAAKAEKDAEKKAKDEAQAKKEKSQLRLGAFFQKPAADVEGSGPSSRRSSIASCDMDLVQDAGKGSEVPQQQQISDYEKTFPPFFLHAHTTLAPVTVYSTDEPQVQWAIQQIDRGMNEPDWRPDAVLGKRKRSSYIVQPPVKRLLLEMQGSTSTNPIDLDGSKFGAASKAFKSLPVKYLKFKEDIRPPWIGTFSKVPERPRFAALCRNPFRRELAQVNYDYDSEAEWEEPEEGEDLNSEGEEDDDDEDDDMEEFLDDEAAEVLPKRKQLIGDLEPVYTGLNWENASSNIPTMQFGSTSIDLEQYRMGILLETPTTFPIDPFSTSYWLTGTSKKSQSKASSTDGNMQPPARVPLNTLQGPNQISLNLKNDTNNKPSKIVAGAKPFPPELLADFKKAISGNNLSKVGLVEVLKKDFPTITKKTVEQTLLQVAKRVGKKEAEKTWQLNE